MEEPQIVTLPLAMVKPYWRNPRDNRAKGRAGSFPRLLWCTSR